MGLLNPVLRDSHVRDCGVLVSLSACLGRIDREELQTQQQQQQALTALGEGSGNKRRKACASSYASALRTGDLGRASLVAS